MVCPVLEKMYFLASLFTDSQVLVVSIVLCILYGVFYYRSRGRPSIDQKIDFKTLVSTKFSDSCSLNWPLVSYNRFRVGGNAEIFFRAATIEQLMMVLRAKPRNMPVTVLGMGSNVLIRDGGVPGLVVHMVGRGFAHFNVVDSGSENKTEKGNRKAVECGAGLSQLKFAKLSAQAGISGLEFMCGIPGTIGGALRMNAGAHGSEVSDRLISATVVDPNSGHIHDLSVSQMKLSYRHCGLPDDWIFVAAKFRGDYLIKSREEIECAIDEMMAYREDAQPVNERTAGCTFANPPNCSAWKLIADAGCEGKVIGGAQVSPKHCNFLVNTGTASAEDLESLGEAVQVEVEKNSGVRLNWEVKRIGIRLQTQAQLDNRYERL